MKNLILIFLLLILSPAKCQLSISAGMNRRMEGSENNGPKFFSVHSTMDSKYINDYFNIRVDQQMKWFLLSGEISLLVKKGVVSEAYDSWTYGPGQYYSTRYFSKANYAYLGVKLAPNCFLEGPDLIFNNTLAGITFGPFIQIDFLVNEEEYDHLRNYKPTKFRAVSAQAFFLSYGARFLRRTTYKNMFIEGSFSTGLSANDRRILNVQDDYERNFSKLFFELGISVGYTFTGKQTKPLDP